jgi:membrane protein
VAGAIFASAERFIDAEAYRLAASLSFYTFSSIFPLMLVAIGLGKVLLGDSESLQNSLISALDATHSPALRSLLQDTLISVRDSRNHDLWGVLVGAVASLFGASGIFLELDAAMTKIFRVPQSDDSMWVAIRKTLVGRATALLVVIVSSVLLLSGTLMLAAVEAIVSHVPILALAFPGAIMEVTAVGLTITAVFLGYKVLPRTPVSWKAALIGGTAGGLALHFVRWPLTLVLTHVTNYSAYGVVGTLLVLLTWFYVASAALLFGAAITAVANMGEAPAPLSVRARGGRPSRLTVS